MNFINPAIFNYNPMPTCFGHDDYWDLREEEY